MEGGVQFTTQLFLTRSQKCSARADPIPKIYIDGIVVVNPEILPNLIILSHDFILLLSRLYTRVAAECSNYW